MPFDLDNNTFLLAGPVKMHPRVLRALARPAMAHRDPAFVDVNRRLNEGLKMVYQTTNPVVTLAGSGTAGMDAALLSLLKKNEKVVALENGKFGNRLSLLAQMYGDATVIQAEWGQPFDLDTYRTTVERVKPKVVCLTHNETSVGFANPLREIAKIAKDNGALVVADCITSIGGMDVPVDAWGLDVVIVGSQKSMGMPSGLCFVSISPAAAAAMHKDNGYYLNLLRYLKKNAENDTPFTPAIPLHLAAVEALDLLREEGLQNRFVKVRAQADAVRDAFEAMGVELFVPEGYRSDTVTAMRYPAGVEDSKMRKTLKEKYGVVIAGGQDHVKGKIFRVGHMGTVSFEELAGGLLAIEKALLAQNAPIKRGAALEAFSARMP